MTLRATPAVRFAAALATLVAGCGGAPAEAPPARAATIARAEAPRSHDAASAPIRRVVETFRTSILRKDKASFVDLFLDKTVPWIAVVGDETLARQRAEVPDSSKIDTSDNYMAFIDWVCSTNDTIEEKLSGLAIETDGDVASVIFDYSFHKGAQLSNWGKESWQLVRTDRGWKIASVVYSRTKSLPAAR